jgi:hypothetical protein
MEAEF